tara:strand:+ start:3553 stop:4650 length:1098 start_codon:yes stop_codon:yes gene_type:complete
MAIRAFTYGANTDAHIRQNITIGQHIKGPSTFTIDPGGDGQNTGTLVVQGDLQVQGTQTNINSSTLTVDDLNITVADGAGSAAAANGAGLTVAGANATLTWTSSNDSWNFNKKLTVSGVISATSGTSTEWNTAYGWGDHSGAGYLTSETFTSLVQDTTPQLGGELDANSNNIDLNGGVIKDTSGNVILMDTVTVSITGSTNAATISDTGARFYRDVIIQGSNDDLIFNKGTYTTTLSSTNPSAQNQTATLLDATGYIPVFTTAPTSAITDGSAGQVLQTDGNGALSFVTVSSASETDTLDSVTGRGATTSNSISVNQLTATIATGTAPLVVSSTTKVNNLNADKVDDKDYDDFVAEATALSIALG